MKNIIQKPRTKIKSTPENNPGKYLFYNTRSHKILLYAKFRNNKPFTAVEYKSFLMNKLHPARVDDALRYLTKFGYLRRKPHPSPPVWNLKNIYEITLSGEHALVLVASQEEKRIQRRNGERGKKNALDRWGYNKNEYKEN